jgi:hypothetical protein
MRRARQSTMKCFDRTVAFAGRLSQAFRVRNIDGTSAAPHDTSLLARVGDNGNRIPLHADQLCQGFLRQRQRLATAEISYAPQPPRQACFNRVRGVACRGLLRHCEQGLLMARHRCT